MNFDGLLMSHYNLSKTRIIIFAFEYEYKSEKQFSKVSIQLEMLYLISAKYINQSSHTLEHCTIQSDKKDCTWRRECLLLCGSLLDES